MKIFKKVAIVGLIGFITAAMLHANVDSCKMDKRGKHRGQMQDNRPDMKAIFKELNLSDEQKEMLRENHKEMMQTRKAKKEEFKLLNDMNISITEDGVNRERILTNFEKIAKFKATMRANRLENILTILTDEQKEKFIELVNNKI